MMTIPANAVDVTVARTIPGPPGDVFDAWLDPKVPGTLWHEHEKLIFDPKPDGLWYLFTLAHQGGGTAHYGRFVEINRPGGRIRHSWMSRHTLGEESVEDVAKAHETGWNSILEAFGENFPPDTTAGSNA